MEFLREALGEALYSEVARKIGNAKDVKLVNLAEGNYVSKEKYEALFGKYSALNEKISKLKEENAALKEKSDEEKDKLKEENGNLKKELKEERLNFSLEKELLKEGAKNAVAVKALIDQSKLVTENGEIKNLKEIIDKLKKTDGYLFFDEENSVPLGTGRGIPVTKKNHQDYLRRMMGLDI